MLYKHLENIADSTWRTLDDALTLGISQGEETITDNILLHLKRQKLHDLRIIKTPKDLESKKGTDWEWWIGNDAKGWLRYAVQAKKLDTEKKNYPKLKHRIGKKPNQELQHVVLERYAKANDAIALYSFYNFILLKDYKDSWNCPLPLQTTQLGITVTPLDRAVEAMNTRGSRSFEKVHGFPETIPVRCLACCPEMSPRPDGTVPKLGIKVRLFRTEEVPFLARDTPKEIDSYPSELYNRDVGLYPKRILVLRTKDED